MEALGMGFLLGIFIGLVVAITAVVIFAARRAHAKTVREKRAGAESPPENAEPVSAAPPPEREERAPSMRILPVPEGAPVRRQPGGNTMIVEDVENRDRQFSASVQEVRDLLLTLAELIARTETASGRAADAFSTARDTVHRLSQDQDPGLRDAQTLLLAEIDRVLASNAALHSELDRANRGIAEQRRQIEELRVQARIDALTRVPNRAAFDERLSEFISHLKRSSLAFCLLLLDIDHFKSINDEHGHLSGDRILRGIGSKLSDEVRNNDFVARYGGEEFAVIFPGTELPEALPVAERIRADIARTNFRLDDITLKVTISGGIAQCREDMTPTMIVAAADSALYAAKNTGRNRILPHKEADAEIEVIPNSTSGETSLRERTSTSAK